MQVGLLSGVILDTPKLSMDGNRTSLDFTLSFPQFNKPNGEIYCTAFGKIAKNLSTLSIGSKVILQGYLDDDRSSGRKVIDFIVIKLLDPDQINCFSIVGNLPKPVEDIKFLDNDLTIAKTDLRVRKRQKNADQPSYLPCVFYRKAGDTLINYGVKNTLIGVSGASLVFEEWTGSDGEKRSAHRLAVNEMSLLGAKPEEEGETDDTPIEPSKPVPMPQEVELDDIPF